MKRITLVAISASALMGAPGMAIAQDATVDAYGGKGQGPAVLGVTEEGSAGGKGQGPAVLGVTEEGSAGGSGAAGVTAGGGPPASGTAGVTAGAPAEDVALPSAARAVPSGSLPFTGLDLALIAMGGVVLLGIGVAMRRFAQPAAH